MKTLKVDNRDLHFTIDTYGMFTGESSEEGEVEYYTEQYKLTEDEVGQIEFDYDHPEVVKALANASVQLLHEYFVQHGDGTVTAIEIEDTKSPQFYNYTTDSYSANWTVDEDKLKQYCIDNAPKYTEFVTENWDYELKKAIEEADEDTQLVIALDFYTSEEYDREDYEMSMFEFESQVWAENMKPSEEFQKILDNKEAKASL